MRPFSRRFLGVLLIFGIIGGGLGLRLAHAADPFLRPHEDDNARYGLAARNHLRLGLGATRGAICLATGGHAPIPGDFYLNHPATLTYILAGSFALLGGSPLATRLPAILASIAGILFLFAATRRRFGENVALLAAGFLAFAPGSVWAGRLAVFLPFILPLGVLALDRHDRAVSAAAARGGAWFGDTAVAVAVLVATLIDWAGLLLLPALALLGRRGLGLPLLAGAVAAAWNLAHILFVAGSSGILDLLAHALGRAGLAGLAPSTEAVPHAAFAWSSLPRILLFEHLPYLFTPFAAIAALAGLALAVATRSWTPRTRWLAALLSWGALYVACFPQAAAVHDYWVYYLLPAAGIGFGLAVDRLAQPTPGGGSGLVPRRIIALLIVLLSLDQALRILERRYWNDTGWYKDAWEVVAFAHREGARPGDTVIVREPIHSFIAQNAIDCRVIHSPEIPHTMGLIRSGPRLRMNPGP